jgi:Flp pilus assembly pilin Flp
MKKSASLRVLLKRVHQDERGVVSLETILIIGAIALPILIFLIKVGWPRVKDYFQKGMDDLEEGSDNAIN